MSRWGIPLVSLPLTKWRQGSFEAARQAVLAANPITAYPRQLLSAGNREL